MSIIATKEQIQERIGKLRATFGVTDRTGRSVEPPYARRKVGVLTDELTRRETVEKAQQREQKRLLGGAPWNDPAMKAAREAHRAWMDDVAALRAAGPGPDLAAAEDTFSRHEAEFATGEIGEREFVEARNAVEAARREHAEHQATIRRLRYQIPKRETAFFDAERAAVQRGAAILSEPAREAAEALGVFLVKLDALRAAERDVASSAPRSQMMTRPAGTLEHMLHMLRTWAQKYGKR